MLLKHKKKLLIICTIILLMFIIISLFINIKRENLQLETGDNVENIAIIDFEGNTHLMKEQLSQETVVFYISENCHPCVSKLPSINILCKAVNAIEKKPIIVWRKSIPQKMVDENLTDCNYSLKSAEFSNFTPDFYIIKDNKVAFETQNFEKLIKKILLDTDINEMRKKLLNLYIHEYDINDEYTDFIFLDENSENISNIYDITDSNSSYITISSENSIDCNIYDPQNVLSAIFNINKFPAILRCNSKTLEFEELE